MNTRLCRFLYNQRKTVHASTEKTPAELMFNRKFRVTIESVQLEHKASESLSKLGDKLFQTDEQLYQVGDAVYVRNFGKGVPWVSGKIVQVLGLRNYKVQVQSFGNIIWKRHADQIMHRYIGDFDYSGNKKTLLYPSTIVPVTNNGHEFEQPSETNIGNSEITSELSKPIHPDNGDSCVGEQSTVFENEESHTTLQSPSQRLRRSGRVVKPPDRLNL